MRSTSATDRTPNAKGPPMTLAPFTPDHDIFRKTVRDFCQKELAPHSHEWDEEGIFPRELFNRFGELGLFGINYPEDVGGSGLDYWYVTAFVEELTHARNAGVGMSMMVQGQMATPILNVVGTDEVKQEFLVP